MRPWLLAAVAPCLAAACGGTSGGEGQLLRALGDDADLVIVAAPGRVAGTWLERAALLVAPTVPPCVQARARAADTVAVTWDQGAGPLGAWSLAMQGGGVAAPGCEALATGDGLAWYGADPRAGGGRFVDVADRKRRWRALGVAPVRALADVELQPGIVVHGAATLDPADGVDAQASFRFDARSAADGLTQLLGRWRGRLDRARLGGAWPALAVELARDPRDPSGATLRAELRLPGASGEEAMIFATAAFLAGELGTPGAPCRWIADPWVAEVSCAGDGRYVVAATLRDRVLADPQLLLAGARVVPAFKNGAAIGFKLYSIRPAGLIGALGFENGDLIRVVGGVAVTSATQLGDLLAAVRAADRLTIELERRGKELALRYELR